MGITLSQSFEGLVIHRCLVASKTINRKKVHFFWSENSYCQRSLAELILERNP